MTAFGEAIFTAYSTLDVDKAMAVRACVKKTRWSTQRDAARHNIGADGFRLFTYQCPFCNGWHLTKRLQG